jgi:hypothetical protein
LSIHEDDGEIERKSRKVEDRREVGIELVLRCRKGVWKRLRPLTLNFMLFEILRKQ